MLVVDLQLPVTNSERAVIRALHLKQPTSWIDNNVYTVANASSMFSSYRELEEFDTYD